MDENMGPADDECPARILDLLSPNDHEWAVDWRARCRANLVRRALNLTVKAGTAITFAARLTFTDGSQAATFVYTGKASTFTTEHGTRVRIPGWRDRHFTIGTRHASIARIHLAAS